MKLRIITFTLVLVCVSTVAQAQSGFSMPTGSASVGQDEFHAADGTSCRTTMDGMKRLEVGSYGSGGDNLSSSAYLYGYPYGSSLGSRLPSQKSGGVYARFSMSLDASHNRMDCNKLYELELERRRLEIEIMKRSLVGPDQRLNELKQQSVQDPRPTRETKSTSGLRGGYPPL